MNAQYDHRGARIRVQPTPNPAEGQQMSAGRLVRLQMAEVLTNVGATQTPPWTIQSPVDWPTPTTAPATILPLVGVDEGGNDKAPWTRGPKAFNTDVHIKLTVRTRMFNDRVSAQDAIDGMEFQIEQAVFNDYALTRAIQQWKSWSAQKSIDADGNGHMGAMTILIQLEVPEVFDPPGACG